MTAREAVVHRLPTAGPGDVSALRDLFDAGALDPAHRGRVRAVIVKGTPDRAEQVRGHRHIVLDDTDAYAERHVRATLGGGALGDGRIVVSGGAEHQGPDGGGLIAEVGR